MPLSSALTARAESPTTAERLPGQVSKTDPQVLWGEMSRTIFRLRAEAGLLSWHSAPLARGLSWVFRYAEQGHRRPTGGARRRMISSSWLSLLLESVVRNGPEPSRARR